MWSVFFFLFEGRLTDSSQCTWGQDLLAGGSACWLLPLPAAACALSHPLAPRARLAYAPEPMPPIPRGPPTPCVSRTLWRRASTAPAKDREVAVGFPWSHSFTRWAVTPVWCVMMTTPSANLLSPVSSVFMSPCHQRWRNSPLSTKVRLRLFGPMIDLLPLF